MTHPECGSRQLQIPCLKLLTPYQVPPGYKDPWCKLNHFNSNNFKIKDVIGIHFYRFLTIIDKGQNPEDGDAKIRIKEPNLVKSLELEIYGKLLNKWD